MIMFVLSMEINVHVNNLWHTFDGESGLHARMDVVSHMTVE